MHGTKEASMPNLSASFVCVAHWCACLPFSIIRALAKVVAMHTYALVILLVFINL
jgi:hypothetical protein